MPNAEAPMAPPRRAPASPAQQVRRSRGNWGRHPAQKMHAGTKLPIHTLTFLPGVFGDEG